MSDTVTDGRNLLSVRTPASKDAGASAEKPTPEEFQEAVTPDLSADFFMIAGRQFSIRTSSIKTQKIMAAALDTLKEVAAGIDFVTPVKRLFAAFQTPPEKTDGSEPPLAADYDDVVDLVQTMLRQVTPSEVLCAMMAAYSRTVFAICVAQDKTVTIDWVEEHIGFADAADIVFRQLEKDRIQNKVVSFLAVATRLMIGDGSSTPPI